MTIYDRFGNELTSETNENIIPEELRNSEPLLIFDSERDKHTIELFDESKEMKIIITKIEMPSNFHKNGALDCEYTIHIQEGSAKEISEDEVQKIVGEYLNSVINELFTQMIEISMQENFDLNKPQG